MKKIIGYYQFDDENWSVALVTKDFWEQHKGLDDSGSEEPFVPNGFGHLAEGVYEHEFDDMDTAKKVLESAGWVEKQIIN